MSDFDNIGKLMHLKLTDIEPGEKFSESEFIINAAAETVLQTDGRNWIPVIVKEISDYQYQVVSNHFVYAVAQQAELERVWCIVVSPESQNIEQAKILAREVLPKVNLNTASRNTILAALRYLISEPSSALKGVDPIVATNRIAESNRKTWSNFDPIVTLRCGITKGKKLDALAKVFFLSPLEDFPQLPPPEIVSIKSASRDEVFPRLSYLSKSQIDGFEAIDIEKSSDVIFSASKGKWKSLNPIYKLECGIDTTKIKALKKVFSL
ncbi:MAG: Rho termination factor [Nostoc sp.]|uniref:Rho termination factor n=1 Tax=Nostoc sp. TaxID=1180 RepID=UPI002FF643F2